MSIYSAAVIVDAPIAFWGLDTFTGTEADLGSGGHTLTYTGAVVRSEPGLISSGPNRAASFTSTSTYCQTPNVADLRFTSGPWALEAWVKPTTLVGFQRIICCGAGGGKGFYWGLNGTGLVLTIPGVTDILTTTVTLSAGKHYLVANFNADNSCTFYVDGFLGQQVANATTPLPTTVASELRIGQNNAGTEGFVGTIGSGALYASGLTGGQVLNHWLAGSVRQDLLNAGSMTASLRK